MIYNLNNTYSDDLIRTLEFFELVSETSRLHDSLFVFCISAKKDLSHFPDIFSLAYDFKSADYLHGLIKSGLHTYAQKKFKNDFLYHSLYKNLSLKEKSYIVQTLYKTVYESKNFFSCLFYIEDSQMESLFFSRDKEDIHVQEYVDVFNNIRDTFFNSI